MQWLKLSYSSWSSGLLVNMNAMRQDEEMCDVRIILDNDVVLLAHSNVLAAASPFFKSILVGTDNPEVNMQDFPVDIVKCVLDFIYTGQTSVKKTNLLMLNSVATSLNIPALADMSKKMVQHSLPVKSTARDHESSRIIITPNLETSETADHPDADAAISPYVEIPEEDNNLTQKAKDEDSPGMKDLEEEDPLIQLDSIKMEVTEAGLEDVEDTDEEIGGDDGGDEGDEHSYAAGDATDQETPKAIGSIIRKGATRIPVTRTKSGSRPVKLYGSPSKKSVVSKVSNKSSDSYVYEMFDESDGSGDESMNSSRMTQPPDDDDDNDDVTTKNLTDSTPENTKYKIIKNGFKGGKDKLVSDQGYMYIFSREGTFGKFWKCNVRSGKTPCQATVKQHNDVFVRGAKPHIHGPEPNILTIKTENSFGTPLNVHATEEINFSAYSIGEIAGKTFRIATKASRRGKDLLIDSDGYKYTLRKQFKFMTLWQCSVRSKTCTCHASVSQRGNKFVEGKNKHVHPADSNKPFGYVKPPRQPRMPDNSSYMPPTPAITPAASNQDIYGAIYTIVYDNGRHKLVSSTGYTYGHRRQGVTSVQWRCNGKFGAHYCSASVRQYEDMYVLGKLAHNHPPNKDLITTPNVKVPPADSKFIDLFPKSEATTPVTSREPGATDGEGTGSSGATDGEGTGSSGATDGEGTGSLVTAQPQVEADRETLLTSLDGKTYKVIAKATQTGGDMLIASDGYRYTVKRRDPHRISWKCAVRNRWCRCAAALVQTGNMCREGRIPHQHAVNSNRPFGMENVKTEIVRKPKVIRRTCHEDDGFRGNPFEDEYGNKYTILEKASKTKTDKLICSDGFSYTARRNGVHGIQWKCTLRHPPNKCPGSVRQIGEFFVRGLKSHVHPPDSSYVREGFVSDIQTTPTMYTSNGKTYSILHKASKAGKNVLEDSDGYRYNFKSAGENRINWRCAVRNSNHSCNATVRQIGDTFTPGKLPHDHMPMIRLPEDSVQPFMESIVDVEDDTHVPSLSDSQLNMEPQLQSDANNVVELVLVGNDGSANYEFTTVDGQTTFQLPPGMVIHQL